MLLLSYKSNAVRDTLLLATARRFFPTLTAHVILFSPLVCALFISCARFLPACFFIFFTVRFFQTFVIKYFFIGRRKEQTLLYYIVLYTSYITIYHYYCYYLLPTFGHYYNIVVGFYFCLNVILLCYVIYCCSSVTIRINTLLYIILSVKINYKLKLIAVIVLCI